MNSKSNLVISLILLLFFSGCHIPVVGEIGSIIGKDSVESNPHMAARVIRLINAKRVERGLRPLKSDSALNKLAQQQSLQMAAMQCLTHEDSKNREVQDRADLMGIEWQLIGENIARNRGVSDPVARAVNDWMESHGHREAILTERFTRTGVGVTVGEDGYCYLTQVFMQPRP